MWCGVELKDCLLEGKNLPPELDGHNENSFENQGKGESSLQILLWPIEEIADAPGPKVNPGWAL